MRAGCIPMAGSRPPSMGGGSGSGPADATRYPNGPTTHTRSLTMPRLKVVPKAENVETEVEEAPKRGRRKAAQAAAAPAAKEKKTGRYLGVTTGMGVTEFQNQLM